MIIGTAFGKIVTSIVEDIIMPPIGWIIGNVNFTDLKVALPSLIEGQKVVTINYGNFLQIALNFVIVAFCVFMVVKAMNKAMPKKKEVPKPTEPTDIELLTEIRDLLKK